jgi:protoporphyrinogen oxidase
MSPEMAPPNKAGLYVELVDRQEPALDQLLPEVTRALVEMGLVDSPRAVAFARVRRIDHAYVVFDHDTARALGVIEPFLRERRISSCGRYGGWNYSAMGDALCFGEQAAEQAVALLAPGAERGPT